jgi:dihydroorotate dehydrogenase (fumarate)/dihydroorotate dehydrogenase
MGRAGLAPLLAISDRRLETTVAGVRVPESIGLAAGYDKSAESVTTLAALGFGSVEVGSVSIDPSAGNPKPRLWRLPQDRALLVHYGMQNRRRPRRRRAGERSALPVPLGINIAVTNRGHGAPPLDPDSIIADMWKRRACWLRMPAT